MPEEATPKKKAAAKKKTASPKAPASPKDAPAKKKTAKKVGAKAPKKTSKSKAVKKLDSKVNIYGIGGKSVGTVELPKAFMEEFRPSLIRRAVTSARANRRQPYGPSPKAGMRHAVSTWGKGRGTARVQRLTQGSTAAESPNNVGGRRAHPPRPEKDWSQKINAKERLKARRSALGAVRDPGMVSGRGHQFKDKLTLPVIVEDKFEKLTTTVQAKKALENLGLYDDILRAKNGTHIRAGRGKMRGRRFRTPKSILVVVNDPKTAHSCLRNLPGVDVATPASLNTELLAPGGDPGRLTVFTEGAIKTMEEWT